jgi:peroxiredoxin
MAWNPRHVWFVFLISGILFGCWGCEQAKKAENDTKPNTSGETAKPKPPVHDEPSSPQIEETPAKSTKNPETTISEPKANPVKPSVDASASSADDTPPPVPGPKTPKPTKAVEVSKTVKKPLPTSAAIPKVSLSDRYRATCLVSVGDELPAGELLGIDGKMVALKNLYGDSLTVVFLWNVGATTYSQQAIVELLADMQKDILEPYAAKDLKVVGINVGNKPEKVKKSLDKSGVKFPILLDLQNEYFKSVAKEKLPRVYLIDATGKILWFDIEYARATRRELLTAIKAILEGKK